MQRQCPHTVKFIIYLHDAAAIRGFFSNSSRLFVAGLDQGGRIAAAGDLADPHQGTGGFSNISMQSSPVIDRFLAQGGLHKPSENSFILRD